MADRLDREIPCKNFPTNCLVQDLQNFREMPDQNHSRSDNYNPFETQNRSSKENNKPGRAKTPVFHVIDIPIIASDLGFGVQKYKNKNGPCDGFPYYYKKNAKYQ